VIVGMVSRNVSRQWLLAGTSLIALSLASSPALAQCFPAPPAVVGTTGACLSWSSGNLTVTNSGAIFSVGTGIIISGVNPTGTLSNSGIISGSAYGIFNNGGTTGTLSNETGGTISGGTYGIYNGGTTGNPTIGTIATLTNHGTISGTINGIYSTGTIGVLTNESDGTISGGTTAGINNNTGGAGGGTIGTLTNSGIISGGFYGIYSQGSIGLLTNESGGTISSGGSGINNSGTIGALTNSGAISGGGYGIANTAAGVITTLTNESGGTISSASWSGIFNNGAIGALTNHGAISGTIGVFNQGTGTTSHPNGGSIGTLTNSGTIGGNTYGIHNTGMIGALTNLGTITGPTAIYNGSTGTIGPIANSGLIAGNIRNEALQVLTISGSSGATYGTLTGSSGSVGSSDKGTITNTSSNLIFDTGNILLNDDIDATGHSVTVANATVVAASPITGNLAVAGTIAPGSSIGTFTVNGNYTQTGVYAVDVDSTGQSGRIVVSGTATLTGGTVSVQAQNGTYQRNTVYTILTAGSLGGTTYSGVTSNLAFLTPSLGYSGDAVTLTLLSTANSFRSGAQTPGQYAVATVLDNANSSATGDFNDVLNALYNLDTTQGPAALDAIGGQSYAGFSSLSMQGSQLFMDGFQVQAGDGAAAGGSASLPGSTYMALKTGDCGDTCDIEPLWGAWGGGMGAFGTVAGDSSSHGLTYNLGGFIAGLDRRLAPDFRAGIAAGFNAATLYTNGMPGTGTSNTLQFAFYGAYAPGPLYLDALAGYGHSDNRMNRPIVIPGLPFRMARGYTTANTFFGQLETGYKLVVAPSFGGFVTPFARLQASTSTQAGFSETGADSLNLTVAQQITNSLRTVLGAQLGVEIDTPWDDDLDLAFRLGWSHEFADQTRPVTAAFAGAPAIGFTTFGAEAPRDGVVLGLGANTEIAEDTSVYLRYDGDLAGSNTNHVLNAGVRYVW
jgi:uncharacterized protein with beta-barrel porin domain